MSLLRSHPTRAPSPQPEIPMEIGIKHDWADIPMEIAAKICEHIELYHDYEAFSEVCSSWRLATKEFRCQYINKKHTQLPLLTLVDPDDSSYKRYYSLSKSKFLKIDLPTLLCPPRARRYFSSRGWLVSVSRNVSKCIGVDTYFDISIFNPLSKNNVIFEAPLFYLSYVDSTEWEEDMLVSIFGKFIVSTCPNNANDSDEDFVVAMTFGDHKKVAYWRLGHDDTWVVPHSDLGLNCLLTELIFFRGELYATQDEGMKKCRVISFGDLKNHSYSQQPRVVGQLGEVVTNHTPANMDDLMYNYYLVESKYDQGDTSTLLLILRVVVAESYDENKYNTASFSVFKLNVDNGNVENVKILGNQAIFVGFNTTFAVLVCSDVDDDRRCKANCIYFTDDCHELHLPKGGGSDTGIYSLRQGNILPFPSRISCINPPIWIELPSA